MTAYDCTPPGDANDSNEFHGDCPSFTEVSRGSPNALDVPRFASSSLLLCYPPPNKKMALLAAQKFRGNTLLHVGEWAGDTGDAAFEAELAQGWILKQRLPLPNYGYTADDLTVWVRRSSALTSAKRLPAPPAAHPVLSCDHCGKPAMLTRSAQAAPLSGTCVLRRCRYCRLASYCSAACAQQGQAAHQQLHCLKHVTIARPLDFDGRDYHAL